MAHNWAMNSRLVRAAHRPVALLSAFILGLLGIWFGVVFATDRGLLDQLGQIPGVSGVTDRSDHVQVLISNELTPKQTQTTFDMVARLAKNQLFYRWKPVDVGVGSFTVRIDASPPVVPLGNFRADIARILGEHGGMVSGELTREATVRVELESGVGGLGWAMAASELLEHHSVTGVITAVAADGELTLYSGAAAQRKQMWDLHYAVTGAGGQVDRLTVGKSEVAGQFTAPDRGIASAMLDELGHVLHNPGRGADIRISVGEEFSLIGLGDHRAAFAFVDRLAADDRRVTALHTDLSELAIEVDSPEAIDSFLEQAAAEDFPMPGRADIRVVSAESASGGFSGHPDTINRYGPIFQSLWQAGYPDIEVDAGDVRAGCQVGFRLASSQLHDFTEPADQSGLISTLRQTTWPGLGCFVLSPDPEASALTFVSSRDGRAEQHVRARRAGRRAVVGWSRRFIDRWNETASA